jgi:hypothetical protein
VLHPVNSKALVEHTMQTQQALGFVLNYSGDPNARPLAVYRIVPTMHDRTPMPPDAAAASAATPSTSAFSASAPSSSSSSSSSSFTRT